VEGARRVVGERRRSGEIMGRSWSAGSSWGGLKGREVGGQIGGVGVCRGGAYGGEWGVGRIGWLEKGRE